MATNLHIDEDLLDRAVKAGKFKTKRDAVNTALAEFVQRNDALKAFRKIAGTIDFVPGYDPKQGRRKR